MNDESFPTGEALRELLAAPRTGRLEAIVERLGQGHHRTPARARLTQDHGLVGDRWRENPRRERQLTLMDARVIRMLLARRPDQERAQGELLSDEPLHAPGDNLVIDLQTSEHVLPRGTRIRIGEALIETNDVPHLGCKKFEARFGAEALAWVNATPELDLHLRGIHATVIEDGAIAVGDVLRIVG